MNEVEVRKENELFVNTFLNKFYGTPYRYSDEKGESIQHYPCLEIKTKKVYTNYNSRKRMIFSKYADEGVKKELINLATKSELTPYRTLPKIERMIQNFKKFGESS
ncbi:MAG: hypothetical protein Q8Q04_01320 [archaeon]|nr:hypothetical protein [archaeon]